MYCTDTTSKITTKEYTGTLESTPWCVQVCWTRTRQVWYMYMHSRVRSTEYNSPGNVLVQNDRNMGGNSLSLPGTSTYKLRDQTSTYLVVRQN